MSGAGNVIRPKANRSGSRVAWLVALAVALALGSGCAGHDSGMGYGNEFAQGVRPHSDDAARVLRNAHYLKMTGQSAMALKDLEEAHHQNPGNLKVANVLAQYYDELKMSDRAQKVYQEALAHEPDNPVLNNNLCYSYYLAGNWQQAETCYRQLLARHPQNQAARNNLGLLLCRQGRGEEAKRLWQETEGKAVAERKLGEVMAALGRTGETRYARQIRPTTTGQAAVPQTKPPAKLTAAVGFPPPKPSPPAHQSALNPESPASDATTAGAPAKKVAIPRPGSEPSLPSRKVPTPMPFADRLAAARPVPPVSRPEPRSAVKLAKSAIPPAATPAPAPAAAPVPPPSNPKITPAEGTKAPASQAEPPSPPEPQEIAPAAPPPKKPLTAWAKPITAKELMETKIAVINGNGLVDLARDTRSLLSLEGFNVVTIANYRDFGVDHTVIHYRPDSERVAALLNHKFFPGAAIEQNHRLAGNIDVEVILGRDLLSQEHAAAPAAARRQRL
jgi:Tfp pilus assembly protein PilF